MFLIIIIDMKLFTKASTFNDIAEDENLRIFKDTFFPWNGDYDRLKNIKLKDSLFYQGIDSNLLIKTLNTLKTEQIANPNFTQFPRSDIPSFIFNLSNKKQTFIIIPGGGYEKECYLNEGFMMATYLNKLGFNAIVISYRTGKNAKFPNPLIDAADSIKYLFENKNRLNLNLDNYALIGFSAGGHLAGTITSDLLDLNFEKPNTLILGYPVISLEKFTHLGTAKNFLQDEIDNLCLRQKYSVNNLINTNYPRTYLWQCDEDNCVPFENSLLMANELKKKHIDYEFKIYHSDIHGLGVARNTIADGWVQDAINFYLKGLKTSKK